MGEGGWVEFKNLGSSRLHYFLVRHKKQADWMLRQCNGKLLMKGVDERSNEKKILKCSVGSSCASFTLFILCSALY